MTYPAWMGCVMFFVVMPILMAVFAIAGSYLLPARGGGGVLVLGVSFFAALAITYRIADHFGWVDID